MVKRILNILNREFAGLHQAAYLLGVFAFLSQILALLRDRMLAHTFGASSTLDVYYAAFRIPDLIYIIIASFVSITVLIPFLAERIDFENKRGGDKALGFLSTVFSVFLSVIILVSIAAFFIIPKIADIMVPGFSEIEQSQFITLTRILLLSPVLLGLSSLLGSVTQTYHKFFVYAAAPVLYNIGIIAGILFLLPVFGIKGVVYGVLLGAFLHLLVQVPVVVKHGLFPRFSFRINMREIKNVAKLSLPRTITLSATHITLIVLIAAASLMEEGSIAIFNFSLNLQSVPLAIIGVSYSVAAFPTLARYFSDGQHKKFAEHIIAAMRHIIFWSTPAIVLFIVLRAQIVRSILGSGEFDWSDTRLTAAALALFSISILAQALQLLFVRAYYAAGRTAIPLVVNVVSAVIIIGLAFMLTSFFRANDLFRYFMESLLRIEGIGGTAIVMLPLAYSIGMIMNVILLWSFFAKDFKDFSFSLHTTLAHSFSASIIMGFVSYQALAVLGNIFDIDTFRGIFSQGLYAGIIGIIAGIAVLKLLKNTEITEIVDVLKRKFTGTSMRVIAPDREELQ